MRRDVRRILLLSREWRARQRSAEQAYREACMHDLVRAAQYWRKEAQRRRGEANAYFDLYCRMVYQ